MAIVITAILFFVILALSAASKGDTSGIEAILKFILYASCILGILSMLAFYPQILLIIILGVIAFYICSSVYNKYKHNQMKNGQENINLETNIQEELPANVKTTDFMFELNSITKTPQEIESDLYNEIKLKASSEYRTIRRNILKKAEYGEYAVIGEKKLIVYYHDIEFMNFTKEQKVRVTETTGILGLQSRIIIKTIIIINEKRKKEYDFFIENINKLATIDGIAIEPVVRNNSTREEYHIPTPILGIYLVGYKLYLKCSVKY